MITRRTTLKAIAAAIMAPTIQLRQSIPDERLLAAFCDTEPMYCSRYHLSEPFGHGSLTYATDAKAMVRAEIGNRLEVGERRLPPNIDDIWSSHFEPDGKWRPLTLDDIAPTKVCPLSCVPCPECGGRRISLGDTYPDFEDPVVDAMMHKKGYDVDDNSILDANCKTCRGMNYHGKSIFLFNGIEHATHACRRIVALPNVRVCQSRFVPEAMLFRADGFEGISLGLGN